MADPRTFQHKKEAIRIDAFSEAEMVYVGRARAGSDDGQAAWQIYKIFIPDGGEIVKVWAGGNTRFDNVWDDRLSLEYS